MCWRRTAATRSSEEGGGPTRATAGGGVAGGASLPAAASERRRGRCLGWGAEGRPSGPCTGEGADKRASDGRGPGSWWLACRRSRGASARKGRRVSSCSPARAPPPAAHGCHTARPRNESQTACRPRPSASCRPRCCPRRHLVSHGPRAGRPGGRRHAHQAVAAAASAGEGGRGPSCRHGKIMSSTSS